MFGDTKVVIRSRNSKDRTIQWLKEKGQKDEQWSTKDYTQTNNRTTLSPLNNGVDSDDLEG